MLVEVARRLTAALRSDDVLSRFGGDEFTVLVRDADRRDLAAVAEELLATFAEPFVVDGREFFMSGSIGRSEEHTSELQSLMRISYAVFCLKKKKTQQMI